MTQFSSIFRHLMNPLFPLMVGALAVASAPDLRADINSRQAAGQNPDEPRGSLDAATRAKALLEEAASLSSQGRHEEALAETRKAVAIDPHSPIRFALETYDAHPEIGPLTVFAAVQLQVRMERLEAADQTNRLERITLPKLAPAECARVFQSAVSKVLQEHGFTSPVFVERAGSLCTAISSRPRLKRLGDTQTTSSFEILQAIIEMTPDNEVTLQLVPHAWIGSDFAILGRMFQIELGITHERAEIGRQLKAALAR